MRTTPARRRGSLGCVTRAANRAPSRAWPPPRSSVCGSLRLRDGPRGVHQPDVAECLREVAEQLAGGRIDFLGKEPHVVGEGGCTRERLLGALELARERLRLCQPEGAEQESALLAGQAVLRAVAVDE